MFCTFARLWASWFTLHLAFAQSTPSSCPDTRPSLLEYPQCSVPQPILTAPSTTLLEEQLQATATSHEGKFLSFEEWKAQNLQKQAEPQASRTTVHMSTETDTQLAQVGGSISSLSLAAASIKPSTTTEIQSPRQSSPAEQGREEVDMEEVKALGKKERFNHASFDCAASIIQSNKESKGSSNILKENKDYYMLNTCAASNKFVTIELCNDILVDSIQLANFEFFSGVFKDVKVLVASKYPPGKEGWQELGQFRARQIRDTQTFHFENPLIWTRYVKIELLTFYGNEFYCPLSLVRVFGKTMMEDYKQEGNSEAEESSELTALTMQDTASVEMLNDIERAAEGLVAISDQLVDNMQKNDYGIQEPATVVAVEVLSTMASSSSSSPSPLQSKYAAPTSTSSALSEPSTCVSRISNLPLAYPVEMMLNSTIITRIDQNNTASVSATAQEHSQPTDIATSSSVSRAGPIAEQPANQNITVESKAPRSSPSTHPSTQESIYKQMAKRISLLEANATLSLRYIESQSSLLAQSFSHLSSTQARHLANFLENVNVTMLQRIAHLKQEYEQLYLDASKSITASRHRQEVDMSSLTRKIGALSDDITFFKRLGIFQSVLMLVLFTFLVTSRHAGVDLQSSLHRALHPRSPLASPIIRVGSPTTWRQHLRNQSSFGPSSIYSFPIDQIERPERSVAHSDGPFEDVYPDDYAHSPTGSEHHDDGGKQHRGLGIQMSGIKDSYHAHPRSPSRVQQSLPASPLSPTQEHDDALRVTDTHTHDPVGDHVEQIDCARPFELAQVRQDASVVPERGEEVHVHEQSKKEGGLPLENGAEDYPTPREDGS